MAGAEITRRARLATGAPAGVGTQFTPSLGPYDKANGQAGLYGPTCRGWYQSLVVSVATLHRFHRIVPSRDMRIVALGHVVSLAATNDDSVDFGIYDAAMGKIISTGLTAGKANALGVQTIAITATTLLAGTTYYYAHKYGTIGGTAASLSHAHFGSFYAMKVFGATAGLVEAGDMSGIAGAALPTTLTIANTQSNVPAGVLLEG